MVLPQSYFFKREVFLGQIFFFRRQKTQIYSNAIISLAVYGDHVNLIVYPWQRHFRINSAVKGKFEFLIFPGEFTRVCKWSKMFCCLKGLNRFKIKVKSISNHWFDFCLTKWILLILQLISDHYQHPQASQALVIYGLMLCSGKIRFCIWRASCGEISTNF